MTTAFAQTATYTHTHSIVFLSDNLRNILREVIRENGISPNNLMQEWEIIEQGIRTWLRSGHLTDIVVEFHKPGTTVIAARWDFPVHYTGAGVEDDMWRDGDYLRQLIAKAKKPPSDCVYRIILCTRVGAPRVVGFADCTFLSTSTLSPREAGTVIATAHMTASVTYWK